MAIKTADAALSFTALQTTITGFINYAQGTLDISTGTIKAKGSNSWLSLQNTTWSAFTNYINNFETIKWTAPLLDLGAVQYFTLNVETQYQGSLYLIVTVSETGVFGGEETITVIEDGNYNISAFYGRYVYVTAVVTGQELSQMSVTANTETVEYLIPNVDTSTLSGTNTARVISLPSPVSAIKDIQIQPKAATSYAVNLYVSDTATSKILIPVVVSKSAASPTFALYGIDNDPRDGVVDIQITAMRQMGMYQGNLIVL